MVFLTYPSIREKEREKAGAAKIRSEERTTPKKVERTRGTSKDPDTTPGRGKKRKAPEPQEKDPKKNNKPQTSPKPVIPSSPFVPHPTAPATAAAVHPSGKGKGKGTGLMKTHGNRPSLTYCSKLLDVRNRCRFRVNCLTGSHETR